MPQQNSVLSIFRWQLSFSPPLCESRGKLNQLWLLMLLQLGNGDLFVNNMSLKIVLHANLTSFSVALLFKIGYCFLLRSKNHLYSCERMMNFHIHPLVSRETLPWLCRFVSVDSHHLQSIPWTILVPPHILLSKSPQTSTVINNDTSQILRVLNFPQQ